MNIHLPIYIGFVRVPGFWHIPIIWSRVICESNSQGPFFPNSHAWKLNLERISIASQLQSKAKKCNFGISACQSNASNAIPLWQFNSLLWKITICLTVWMDISSVIKQGFSIAMLHHQRVDTVLFNRNWSIRHSGACCRISFSCRHLKGVRRTSRVKSINLQIRNAKIWWGNLRQNMQEYGYGSIPINTSFSGMNIHLPAILGFTRYQGFDPSPYHELQTQDEQCSSNPVSFHCILVD